MPGEDLIADMVGEISINKRDGDITVHTFEEEKKIRVVAELVGVSEEDVRIELNEDMLFIVAIRNHRRYTKKVKLPRASKNIIWKSYSNGILEVILN